MPDWIRPGFRGKLVAAGVALQLVAVGAVTWNAAELIDSQLSSELRTRAQRDAPLFNAALAAPMLQRDYATVQAIVRESRAKGGIEYIIVQDTAGREVGQDGWPENVPRPDATLPQPARLPGGGFRFDFSVPLALEGQPLGAIQYGLSGASIEDTRDRLLFRTLSVGLVVLVLFSALLALGAHLLTRPLKQLTVASRQVREGNYDVELKSAGTDEIGALTEDFRRMAAEVKRRVAELTESEALQKRTLADLRDEHAALEIARAEADAANAAKSDFLAKMSHEIRTPLHGILGVIDLLSDTRLDDRQRAHLDVVRRSGLVLLEMVNDVLDLSRMLSGKFDALASAFNPALAVRDVAKLFAPRAAEKGLNLTTDIATDIPDIVNGHPTRLRQVLANLISNAVKFTAQGSIVIRVRRTGLAGAETMEIDVDDNGIGIAPDAIERIFQPFSQADDSTTRAYGGSGLGLAISRQIVSQLGWTLCVRSAPGKGSTFQLSIPLANPDVHHPVPVLPPAPAPATPPAAAMGSLGLHVLLAEDNAVNQMLAEVMLRKLGCTLQIAATGTEAVAAFSESAFDIVLMDCHMPEMDGYEAAAAIRTREAAAGTRRTPVVAVTANVMQGERDQCISAGMDDFLSKPFSINELAAMLALWAPGKAGNP